MRAIASTIRRLAWCGMNADRSAGETPARSQARSATGAIAVVAHRKTACPSWVIAPVRPVTWILCPRSPALLIGFGAGLSYAAQVITLP